MATFYQRLVNELPPELRDRTSAAEEMLDRLLAVHRPLVSYVRDRIRRDAGLPVCECVDVMGVLDDGEHFGNCPLKNYTGP